MIWQSIQRHVTLEKLPIHLFPATDLVQGYGGTGAVPGTRLGEIFCRMTFRSYCDMEVDLQGTFDAENLISGFSP